MSNNLERALKKIEQVQREGEDFLDLSGMGLKDNALSSLIPKIEQLEHVTNLNLANNDLANLTLKPSELPQIIYLDVRGNPNIRIRIERNSINYELKLENFIGLMLVSERAFLHLFIGSFYELNKGSFNGVELDMFGNKKVQLPLHINDLKNLAKIDIWGNEVVNLPPEIGQLASLREINISYNEVVNLPPEIGQLTYLREINILGNEVVNLPPEVGQLASLTTLSLTGNKLTYLPPEIGNLVELRTLILENNLLTSLPVELARLSKLTKLALEGNPLRFPPTEIVALGVKAVQRYLGADYFEEVWQSKCVVVGEGGVGKTWLIDALRGNQPDKSIVGTVGIDIVPVKLSHPEQPNTTMQLNCWDFAGQDFNHAMHQFFFSNRALILLVWNARHGWEQGKLTRWLENIKVRAPEAPVLLVATHIDEPHSDYPKEQLQADYPQIKAVIGVSSKTGEKIPVLRDLIQREAAELPLMGVKWPSTWLAAAKSVQELCATDQTYANRSQIYAIMREHDLDDDECDILLRWLHELGNILNFADEEKIADYVILNPEWLTKHLGIVLRSDEVLHKKGILSRKHLRQLWHQLDEQIRTLFLHIMDKFDLAYLIPEDPYDRSLIVERLPLDPPNYAPLWDAYQDRGSEITLRYKLNSMQPGIPTWFIARCHRFTLGRGDAEGMHWLNGVLFQDEQLRHRALIIVDDHNRTVEMRVRGLFPQRFMTLLRDGFRDTLKRYKGLQVERWVPCNGYDELEEKPCTNEFRLDKLERWLEKRPDRTHFHCHECDTHHSRLELVEGVGSTELTQTLTEKRMAVMLDEVKQEMLSHFDQKLSQVSKQLTIIEESLKYQERNFLRLFRQQQKNELITCPNLFTIRQTPRHGVIVKNEWRIQLYCQEPGAWHPVGEPYVLEEQREIIGKALPYLKGLLKVLQIVAPLAGAALALTDVAGDINTSTRKWADGIKGDFENEVKAMTHFMKATDAMVKASPDDDGALMPSHPKRDSFGVIPAADLTPVRQLMDILAQQDSDAGRPRWRGLQRAFTPEGDILWLDEEHLQTYLSQRPRPEASNKL